MRRPNLLFVLADQLRRQSVGFAGDAKAITPHLDAFARSGVDFANAVASTPVCAGYRASLFTGTHITTTHMAINELRLAPRDRCFGHVLTQAGYRTCYVGKWHLYANQLGNHDDPRNSFVPRGPHRLGFDGEWHAYNFHHANYGSYYHTESPEKIFWGEDEYEPEAQIAIVERFIREHADRPWATILSWGPPHDPWREQDVPKRWWDRFAGVDFANPPNYRDHDDEPYTDSWGRLSPRERAELPSWRRSYYAQTASIDELFGRLMATLKELKLDDNTLVVFTSDHGELFGAHGRRAKNIFYEEAVRVPLAMRMPGAIPAGRVSDACIATVDLMPTMCSLLGLDAPRGEGMDLSHLACDRAGPEPDAAFLLACGACAAWVDGHEWRALRDKRHTYAVYRRDGRELLFDNVADPFQLRDLARDPAAAATMATMRARLAATRARIDDGFHASSWYRDRWTDGDRVILDRARGAASG